MDSLLAMDSGIQGADSGNAAGDNKGRQQQGDFTGKDVVSALTLGLVGRCSLCKRVLSFIWHCLVPKCRQLV